MTKGPTTRSEAAAQTVSGAGLLVSCIPMVAMLPGAAGGALGLVGLGASSAVVARFAPALNTVAQPLLLFSVLMLAVGGLRCGRSVVALALVGGALIYVSMYVWTDGDGRTSPGLFFAGLGCFFGAYVVSWWRRRGHCCRPLVSELLTRRMMIGTVVAGLAAVGVLAATADGSGPAMPMTVHVQPGG